MMKMEDKLKDIAAQFARAMTRKEAARLRIQCTSAEWDLVRDEAKKLYNSRV